MDTKKYIALLLLVVVFAHMMQVPLIYLHFELNQEFIAKNLCENRDKPIIVCEGQCYLGKQLDKAQDHDDKKDKSASRKVQFENLYTLYAFQLKLHKPSMLKADFTPYHFFGTSSYVGYIFHPPRLV